MTKIMTKSTFYSLSLIISLFGIGATKGICDSLQFHYSSSRYSSWNTAFWNPEISWLNKYKDYPNSQDSAFLGSKTFFVALTDGWHLMQLFQSVFILIALFSFASFLLEITDSTKDRPAKAFWVFAALVAKFIIEMGFITFYD